MKICSDCTRLCRTKSVLSILMVILLEFQSALRADDGPEPVFDLEPIVVLAEKRHQTLLETPLSISVVTNDRLHSSGVTSIKDVSFLIPNLYISELTARRTSFPYMRGLGAGQGEPVVTTVIDGVPQLTPNTTDIELVNIDRIEFVRGPQGTLYGRNTLGGVIHIITQAPSNENRVNASLEIGEFSLERYKLIFNTPISLENSAFTLGTSYAEKDGFVKNNFTGNTVDDQQTLFGKGTLRLTWEGRWDATIGVFGERDRDGDFVLFDLERLRGDPYRIDHDFEGKTERDVINPSVSVTRHGATTDFSSITGYGYWSATDLTDTDFTNNDLLRRKTDESQHHVYQELRLHSTEDADSEPNDHISLKWLAGLSFFYSNFVHDSYDELRPQLTQLPIPIRDTASFELNDSGIALFGQGSITLYDRLEAYMGLRIDYEHRDADIKITSTSTSNAAHVGSDEDFVEVLPKLGLSYRKNENFMAYGYGAKGFRTGGYNRNIAPTGQFEVEEEESWTYETGLKTSWFANRLDISLALFYIEWDEMQLDVPNPQNLARFFLDNVGEAESKGFEAELQTNFSNNWQAFCGIGYTDAKFEEYVDPVTERAVDGNTLPNIPEFNWHAGLQTRWNINKKFYMFSRIEIIGVGKLFFDNANSQSQNDYIITNFRAGIGSENWSLEAWIKNAFDKDYVSLAFPIPQEFRNFVPSGFVGRSGAPQTVGISLKFFPAQLN